MIEIILDSRARVSHVSREIEREIAEVFTYENPDRERALRLGIRGADRMPPTLRTWKRVGYETSVPRGGVAKLVDAIAKCGETATIVDRTSLGIPLEKAIGKTRHTLHEHQARTVSTVLRERSGLVRSPEGSGKTTIGLAAAAEIGLRTLIVVWTKQLAEQWVVRAREELGLLAGDVGSWFSGKRRIGLVTVATVQSLPSLFEEGHAEDFGFVLVDEAQRYAAQSYFDAIDKFPAAYRLGVSADERRSDGKHFLTWDLFGPILEEFDREELVDDGVILDVSVNAIPTDFREPEWLSEAREAGRRVRAMQAAREPVPFELRKQASEVLSSHGRIIAEMMGDAKRERLVCEVARTAHITYGSVLVLTHRREHVASLLESLADLRPVSVMAGADLAKNLLALKTGEATIAVGTYQAVGVGIDLPALAAGVFATPVHHSKQQFSQFRGRFSRTGKDEAAVFVLWDREVYGDVPLQNFVRWCRTVRVAPFVGGDLERGRVDARSFLRKA